MNFLPAFFLILLIALTCGCVPDPEVIADLKALKQDTLAYLDGNAKADMLPATVQQQVEANYNRILFSPWRNPTPPAKSGVEVYFTRYIANPGFGENKQPRDKGWALALKDLAGFETFPNTNRKAITIKNTSLRLLPTQKPAFDDFNKAGEGYPFDNLQNSTLPPNTPLFAVHTTTDGAWVWVTSAYAQGWLPLSDIAWVNDPAAFETEKYAALVDDQVSITDMQKQFVTVGHIGMTLPLIKELPDGIEARVAASDENHNAVFKTVRLPKSVAVAKSLPLTASAVAELANKMMNDPYGWGGMYDNRDCSSMIQDLFVPFGIWLPRNSNYWISDYRSVKRGLIVRLKDLKPEDKEKMIIQNGIPFLTFLWMKGHVMLYVGSKDGKALAFHNVWGLRTKGPDGKEGRKIIGKAVITTLQPGKERSDFDPNGELLRRIEGMTLLVPRYE